MILMPWVRFIPWYDIGDITTGAACGGRNAYPSGGPNFTSGFNRDSCCPVICVSLFHVIVFCLLSFDCFFSLTAWYLYYILFDYILPRSYWDQISYLLGIQCYIMFKMYRDLLYKSIKKYFFLIWYHNGNNQYHKNKLIILFIGRSNVTF